jgi:riboflavin synthase
VFTGIIVDVGKVVEYRAHDKGASLTLSTGLDTGAFHEGDSIAVNGVCLTAINLKPGLFSADTSVETLRRTTLSSLGAGASVNLEPALKVGDPLGGHMVQGHVDGVGELIDIQNEGEFTNLTFRIPEDLMTTVVEKGSITLDGISLTVAELGKESVVIAVVPHTLAKTNLGSMTVGQSVNVETDIIGKYVRRTLLTRQ